MKICFDAKRATSNFTGLGNYSRTLIQNLQLYYPDNEYLLFTPKMKHQERYQALITNPLSKFITPESWPAKIFKPVWRSFATGILAAARGADVFHGLSGELPFFLPASIKAVLTVHDLIFMRFPAYYKPLDRLIYKFKLQYACKRANQIIAISEQTKNDLISYLGIKPERIKVIYQACDGVFREKLAASEKEAVRVKYQLPPSFLLCVGTLEERKNILMLLKALSLLPAAIELVLVGRRTDYTPVLEKFIQDNKLGNRIFLITNVSFEDLPAFYQLASQFIYPSVFEGFGIPIEEALFSNIAVISSRGSCFAEAGGPDSIYVDPADYQGLANEIENLHINDQKRAKMIRNGRNFAEKFMPARLSAELMAVYT